MNLSAPILLIPWDNVFEMCPYSEYEHLIAIPSSIAETICNAQCSDKKLLIHRGHNVQLSCFYDEALIFNDRQLESRYEALRDFINRGIHQGYQAWVIGNRFLILEFKSFFSLSDAEFIEPANLFPPSLMKITHSKGRLIFEHVPVREFVQCNQ